MRDDVAHTRGRGAVWLVGLLGILVVSGLIWLFDGGAQTVALQVVAWQRDLHRALTLAITELAGAPSMAAWVTLLGISFGYGVFHAAGPGHGKAILTTYLLSQGGALRRALMLSCAASLLQALVAISLVAVLIHGLGWLTRQALGSVVWVELASFAMVTLLGLWLCWRAVRQLRSTAASTTRQDALYNYHGHDHHHANHRHVHHHDTHCDCAGSHHVDPQQAADWRTGLATVVAIGMRPCSGGVLLLGVASLLGQFWVGVSAVLVMALGTALAVSALALASVMARGWAERRLARQSQRTGQRLLGWAALAGGAAIVLLGVSLLMASASAPRSDPLLTPTGTSPLVNPRG